MDDDLFERRRAEYLERMTDLIKQRGHGVQHVMGDPGNYDFSYTVGMAGMGHPEFVIVGLRTNVAVSLLNDIAARVRAGQRFKHGQVLHDLVNDFPVVLIEVSEPVGRLSVANALYGTFGPVAGLQIVFPDAGSRWPWQDGSTLADQPVLGPVPNELR